METGFCPVAARALAADFFAAGVFLATCFFPATARARLDFRPGPPFLDTRAAFARVDLVLAMRAPVARGAGKVTRCAHRRTHRATLCSGGRPPRRRRGGANAAIPRLTLA
jgi:hypothetical protein